MLKRFISILVIAVLLLNSTGPVPKAYADEPLSLPVVGSMVNLTPAFEPALIKGLTIDKNNPFNFNFIMDPGQSHLTGDALKKEGDRLVKYFFTCLTIPEKDLWVNLSPYEKQRILPQALGQTPLGRDLLEQDYILKQLTASLIYPEKDLGKEFWNRVYTKARQLYGTSEFPVNTFNKVWILADHADVFEQGQSAFVMDGYLKVMLEEDYLALTKHQLPSGLVLNVKATQSQSPNALASQVIRTIILPEIEKEVNTGKNFARLRQIFNSLILASWYKKNLKEALLNQVYSDKNTVKGVNLADPTIKEKIYQQYLQAYKKGVFNYIKEESSEKTIIPRKYFSGGFGVNGAMLTVKKDPASFKQIVSSYRTKAILYGLSVALFLNQTSLAQSFLNQKDFSGTAQAISLNDAAMSQAKKSLGTTPGLLKPPELLRRVNQRELKGIPYISSISDMHGAILEFDDFLLFSLRNAGIKLPTDFKLDPYKSLAPQLRAHHIKMSDLKGKIFFHNLGDWMDRGPSGVAVALRSMELHMAGLSDYLLGNHDLYTLCAILGIHLPYYKGFNTHGYTDDYDSQYGHVQDLINSYLEENKGFTDSEKRRQWAKRLADQRDFYNHKQEREWGRSDLDASYLSRGQKLLGKMTTGMNSDQRKTWELTDDGKLWGKLAGYIPNVGEVNTGIKAVGLVSIKWWQNLSREFELSRDGLEPNDPQREVWQEAIDLIKNIIEELKSILEEHIKSKEDGGQGEWWWRIFEATNSENYNSLEWSTQDWPFHEGWGTSVFAELHSHSGDFENYMKELHENYRDFSKYDQGHMLSLNTETIWNDSNFGENPVLQIIAAFIKQNLKLHIYDVMQIDYLHAPLPVDNDARFHFEYRNRIYRGKGELGKNSFRDGLDTVADDVHQSATMLDLIVPLGFVNSLFAENGTEAKPNYVAQAVRQFGIDGLADSNDISVGIVFGHIPVSDYRLKLPKELQVITSPLMVSSLSNRFFILGDGGMSPKYKGGGLMPIFGPDGLTISGRSMKGAKAIEMNPVIFHPISGEMIKIFDKIEPIAQDNFLSLVSQAIGLNILKTKLATGQYRLITAKNVEDAIKNNGRFSVRIASGRIIVMPTKAMTTLSRALGGIDLNTVNMAENIYKNGSGVQMHVDPAMAAEIRKNGVQNLTPFIYKITPIHDASSLFSTSLQVPVATVI